MTDEQTDDSTTETTEVEGQEPEATEQEAGSAEEQEPTDNGEAGADEGDDDGDLPESVKKKLTKLRSEAAGWRTQLREAERKLAEAKSPEDFARVQQEFTDQLRSKDREIVLAKHPLPPELAERLKGGTLEEMLADAKALSKFVTPLPSVDDGPLGGGLDPSDPDDGSYDPAKRAQEIRRRRRVI